MGFPLTQDRWPWTCFGGNNS